MRHCQPAAASTSKIDCPLGYTNPWAGSIHPSSSWRVGLLLQPADDAPCRKNRFGQVGPGSEENHWSHTANSAANWGSTVSWLGVSRHAMMLPRSSVVREA